VVAFRTSSLEKAAKKRWKLDKVNEAQVLLGGWVSAGISWVTVIVSVCIWILYIYVWDVLNQNNQSLSKS
jgi:hypothetical protein